MNNLTANEIAALKACLNYDDRESQLCDNFSDAGVQDFMELLDWDAQQVGGLISSLVSKGMGKMDDDGFDIFWPSEKGIDAAFNALEADQQKEEIIDALDDLQGDYFTAVVFAVASEGNAGRSIRVEYREGRNKGAEFDAYLTWALADKSDDLIEYLSVEQVVDTVIGRLGSALHIEMIPA